MKLFSSARGSKRKGEVREEAPLVGSCSLPQEELGAPLVSEGSSTEFCLSRTTTPIPLRFEALQGICQPDGVKGVFSDEWTS